MTDSQRRSADAASRELTVVGGGVIGLTCALTAADAGWRVRVLDAGADDRASWVAGGMLGSLGEGHPGEEASLALSVESVGRWPALVERLDDEGIVTATDSLFVAASAADLGYLRNLADFVWAQQPRPDSTPPSDSTLPSDSSLQTDSSLQAGSTLHPVNGREIRTLEPSLSSRLVGGYRAVGEWAVDNRRLLAALRSAAAGAGVEFVSRNVESLAELDRELDADVQILLAAGLGTATLWPGARLLPAKGEILRLRRTRWSVPPPRHVIRARLHARDVYLVPRDDGIVVGATQYEPEGTADRTPQAGGVADLLADAIEVLPGLRTYELVEAGAGLRPCTSDGLPLVTRVDTRTVVATGHGRNGIVLAPGTAAQVLSILEGDDE